ncbi:MAG: DUF1573 domain-containing protein [Muribaculaceae bacterium]
MSLRSFSLLSLGIAFLSAMATVPPQSATWLERSHNFGVIDEDGGKVACSMRLANTTDSAISILEVRATCGCTAVHYPKQPIEPGDTAVLTLVFNPHGRPGRFSKGVTVRLSGLPSRTSLTVEGTVRASQYTLNSRYPSLAGPLRLVNHIVAIGEVAKDGSRNGILSAYNASPDTLRLEAIDVPDPLCVQFSHPILPPGEECRIMMLFDASKCTDCIGVTELPLKISATPINPGEGSTMSIARITVVANVREHLSTDFSAF